MRNQGDGSRIARPITEYFFRKVLENKKLGIEKDAKFVKPAEMENEINSADILINDTDPNPGAEGNDQGVGTENDYLNNYDSPDTLGPESKPLPVEGDNKLPKKDTTKAIIKSPAIKKEDPNNKPIGSVTEEPEKKKGFFNRLLKKKND